MTFRLLLLTLLTFVCVTASAQGIHKWVDQNGKTHYSDRPPEEDNVKAQGMTSIEATPTLNRARRLASNNCAAEMRAPMQRFLPGREKDLPAFCGCFAKSLPMSHAKKPPSDREIGQMFGQCFQSTFGLPWSQATAKITEKDCLEKVSVLPEVQADAKLRDGMPAVCQCIGEKAGAELSIEALVQQDARSNRTTWAQTAGQQMFDACFQSRFGVSPKQYRSSGRPARSSSPTGSL